MILFLEILLIFIACLILIPCLVLSFECLMSLFPVAEISEIKLDNKVDFNILIPAYNEETVIEIPLKSIINQVDFPEKIIVIADNCTDKTAKIARQYGVTVLERHDKERRGKGYALDYGLNYLKNQPPDVIVLIDADCYITPGTIQKLVHKSSITQKPLQALYLLEKPENPSPKDLISALAVLVKNQVRSTGLSRLGLPCLLAGTGMAFPWQALDKISLASGNIVEDMQLGIDLALCGYSPIFCPDAQVTGILPQQTSAAITQRTRWEHGHIQTILTQVPRLLKAAITQRRFELLALALELSVPPLSLLVMLLIAGIMITITAGLLGFSWLPTIILGVGGLCLILGILMGWTKFGRKEIPFSALLSIPFYLLWKIPLYFAFLVRPQSQWVRTERDEIVNSK
ncbi:putative glycosyl transferase [Crocosphaera subtropica ATCC 51142]|uniref:Glycosyl transferase n=1 Tax=Crocosphaera subtropica (strain ATCC 51142 / BH68) TaxID=43989 RepID=B1X0I1_CROS5|nr:glycosyltransferase family 2 protein [Crocosphaera subtropica]ACB51270.1 putative glycosyl transferase [Crocosphaera subtropica ATCC 51142]